MFDFDGLLVDSERLVMEAWQSAARELGFEVSHGFFLSLIGLPLDQNWGMFEAEYGDISNRAEFEPVMQRNFQTLKANGVPLMTGVPEILTFVGEAALPMAIATSSSQPYVDDTIASHAIEHHFHSVHTRDQVERGKPHPDLYLAASAAVGVDPRNCIAFEDSTNGAKAALAAGMQTVLVPDLVEPAPDIVERCIAVLDDLHQARDFLSARLASAPEPSQP